MQNDTHAANNVALVIATQQSSSFYDNITKIIPKPLLRTPSKTCARVSDEADTEATNLRRSRRIAKPEWEQEGRIEKKWRRRF